MTNRIWFVMPTTCHNHYGIMAEGDKKVIDRIDRIIIRDCRDKDSSLWNAFHRGSESDWTYWEFLIEPTKEFTKRLEAKIEAIKVELHTPDVFDFSDCDGCTELKGDQECAICRKYKALQIKI